MQVTPTEGYAILGVAALLLLGCAGLVVRMVSLRRLVERGDPTFADARRMMRSDPASDAWALQALSSTLREARRHGRRFEVHTCDFGIDHRPTDMRWQWLIWDADRALRASLAGLDPEGDVGVTVPYMVGNSPTRHDAGQAALAWLQAEEPDRPWVVARG